MAARTSLLVVTVLVGLVVSGWSDGAAAAPPADSVTGVVSEIGGPAEDVQAMLFVWDAGSERFIRKAGVPAQLTDAAGQYSFDGLATGDYTVRFSDTTGVYVAATWPGGTGAAPVGPDFPGVVDVPASQPSTLDVSVLRELRNDGGEPTVTGLRRAGSQLTGTRGVWNETSNLTFSYQWQQISSAGVVSNIEGATSSTYVLPGSMVGYGVRLRVTGSRAGYASENGFSDETEVARGLSSMSRRLARATVHSSGHGRLVVQVYAAAVLPRSGWLAVRVDGRQRVGRYLRRTQLGRASVTLPRLKRGRHRVVAIYAGNSYVYGSTSRAIVLTVIR